MLVGTMLVGGLDVMFCPDLDMLEHDTGDHANDNVNNNDDSDNDNKHTN